MFGGVDGEQVRLIDFRPVPSKFAEVLDGPINTSSVCQTPSPTDAEVTSTGSGAGATRLVALRNIPLAWLTIVTMQPPAVTSNRLVGEPRKENVTFGRKIGAVTEGDFGVAVSATPVALPCSFIEPGPPSVPFTSQMSMPPAADEIPGAQSFDSVSDKNSEQNPWVLSVQNVGLPDDPALELALDVLMGASIALSADLLSLTPLSNAPLELAAPEDPDCPELLAGPPLDAVLPELAAASRSPGARGSSSLRPKSAAQPALDSPMQSATPRICDLDATS
jgi:hypothetical protein